MKFKVHGAPKDYTLQKIWLTSKTKFCTTGLAKLILLNCKSFFVHLVSTHSDAKIENFYYLFFIQRILLNFFWSFRHTLLFLRFQKSLFSPKSSFSEKIDQTILTNLLASSTATKPSSNPLKNAKKALKIGELQARGDSNPATYNCQWQFHFLFLQ